ncbi:MAG: hypothetical protein JXQ87_13780 [Bacteroidia bacterium]
MFRRLYNKFRLWFAKPKNKVLFNIALGISAVVGNSFIQVFCVPVLWASVVLLTTFLPFVLYPLIATKVKNIKAIMFFFFGLAASICIYCIIFLGQLNILGIPLLLAGIGVLVFIPHVYLLQLFGLAFFKKENSQMRKYFIMGLIFSYGFLVSAGFNYNKKLNSIEKAYKTKELIQINTEDYMTERIIGMHFKYHTRFNEYDGWRPPLHDPYLVAGFWLNGFNDPLIIGLEERVAIYKKLYPHKLVQVSCSCARMYSESYKEDDIFN